MYLTLLLIVVSWMLREIHIAFFSGELRGGGERGGGEESSTTSRRQSRMSPRRTVITSAP